MAMSWQGSNKIGGLFSSYVYIMITYKSTERILCVSSLLVLCLYVHTRVVSLSLR